MTLSPKEAPKLYPAHLNPRRELSDGELAKLFQQYFDAVEDYEQTEVSLLEKRRIYSKLVDRITAGSTVKTFKVMHKGEEYVFARTSRRVNGETFHWFRRQKTPPRRVSGL